jgi:hypothetical protein
MRKPPLRAMFPLVLLMCSACASETIHDVTFSSVRAVDYHDQTELPLPGDLRPYIASMAGNPAILRAPPTASGLPALETAERPHIAILKVEFTSGRDLSKIKFADGLSTESFFCRRPDTKVLLGGVRIYSDGQVVPSGYEEAVQRSSTPTGPLHTYYTFLWVARSGGHPGDRPVYEAFDLRRDPEDVCFRLVGGEYRAFGYYSNTVTIPKALIARALNQHPREE